MNTQTQEPQEITARITGYRQLSAEEQGLINAIKAHGSGLELILSEVRAHLVAQHEATYPPRNADGETPPRSPEQEAEYQRILTASPSRWAAIAATDFQTGLMALVRAVAQPSTF